MITLYRYVFIYSSHPVARTSVHLSHGFPYLSAVYRLHLSQIKSSVGKMISRYFRSFWNPSGNSGKYIFTRLYQYVKQFSKSPPIHPDQHKYKLGINNLVTPLNVEIKTRSGVDANRISNNVFTLDYTIYPLIVKAKSTRTQTRRHYVTLRQRGGDRRNRK